MTIESMLTQVLKEKIIEEESDSNFPKLLYHYTSINSLALILSSKKLRLNSLMNVDDLMEARNKDLGDIRKYFFVSCWTSNEEESIPFWKMYTPNMHGVRITLPIYPFLLRPIKYKPKIIDIDYKLTFFSEDIFVNDEYIIEPSNKILYKINYTDNEDDLNPIIYKLIKEDKFNNRFDFKPIGKSKNKSWEFQSEYRYLVHVYPGGGILSLDDLEKSKKADVINAIRKNIDISIDSLFLELDQVALGNIEIVIGPSVDNGERILIEALLDKYCPTAKCTDSLLKGKIKT